MIKRAARLRGLENQIRRLDARLHDLERHSRRFSLARLIIFLGAAGLCILAAYTLREIFGWIIVGLGVIVFNVVAYYHRRLEQSLARHHIWRRIKSTQLARMQIDWQALPPPLFTPADGDHPFESDLDLTGNKSLQHLLDLAISHEGSQRLTDWLLATTPELEQIQQRQKLVQELAPMSRFRDKFLLNFALVTREPLQGKKFLNWLQQPEQYSPRWLLTIFSILAALNIALFSLNSLGLIPKYWLITLFLYGGLYLMQAERIEPIFDESIFLDDELKKLKAILFYLENYPYGEKRNLAQLCYPLFAAKQRPSVHTRKIKLIVTAIGLRMNPMVRILLNAVAPWDWYCAYFLDKQKAKLAESLPQWLDVCFELEALNSLANFAYLNPEYTFPQIRPGENAAPYFQVQNLGHPLIPDQQRVRNDFSMRNLGELAVITGSNMSGKSTFLKTLGTNLSLAFAGGPVCAAHLETSPVRLFTCIKVNDSVTEGFSFFYAEVRRLKALLNALQTAPAHPLFFLIDEIFRGTNNRERLIGSRAYVRALVRQKGFGVISTHDLELTALAEAFPQIHNYHFREEVVDGKMIFDYKLHSGPCPTTNALKIMALAGLPADE
jgi:hypothetical protein